MSHGTHEPARRFARSMQGRDPREAHRVSTPLELLLDHFFAAIAAVGAGLGATVWALIARPLRRSARLRWAFWCAALLTLAASLARDPVPLVGLVMVALVATSVWLGQRR